MLGAPASVLRQAKSINKHNISCNLYRIISLCRRGYVYRGHFVDLNLTTLRVVEGNLGSLALLRINGPKILIIVAIMHAHERFIHGYGQI
jgi:hypothetical protein